MVVAPLFARRLDLLALGDLGHIELGRCHGQSISSRVHLMNQGNSNRCYRSNCGSARSNMDEIAPCGLLPFVRLDMRVDYGPTRAVFDRWVPDAKARQKILWDTPARLFGFK